MSSTVFVCIKDRIRTAIPATDSTFFGLIFGVLFFLLIRKLILGSI